MTAVGDAYPYQIKPDELYGILQPQFQARAEPNFAWKSAVSALMALPGLRAGWSMGTIQISSVGAVMVSDLAAGIGSYNLSLNNNPDFGNDMLIPYVETDGSTEYLYHNDHPGFDLSTSEAWIFAADRGITIGGWFYFNTATVTDDKGLMGKWHWSIDERSYLLYHNQADDTIRFVVSGNGIASVVSPASIIPTVDTWHCIFGRYDRTSLDVELFINGTWYTNAGAGPGAVFDSSARFEVHVYNNGSVTHMWDGRSSLLSLCQRSVPDSILNQFYHQTRSMYGV